MAKIPNETKPRRLRRVDATEVRSMQNGIVLALNQVRDLEEKRRIAIENGPASPGPNSDVMKITADEQTAFDRLCALMEAQEFSVASSSERNLSEQKKQQLQEARAKAQVAKNRAEKTGTTETKAIEPVVATATIDKSEVGKVKSITARLAFSSAYSGIVQCTALVPDFGPMTLESLQADTGEAKPHVAELDFAVAGITPIWSGSENLVAQLAFMATPPVEIKVLSLTPNVDHASLIAESTAANETAKKDGK